MRCETAAGIAFGNPAVQAYLSAAEPPLSAYHHHPYAGAAFADRQRYLATNFQGDRALLARSLVRYNQSLGASAATLAAARRLGEDGCLAVVTGQQAGVLTGPLYTLYKAVSAILLAREQEQALGVPVVPVFWVAAEDHDYREISSIGLYDAEEGIVQLALADEPAGRRSIGHLAVPESAFDLLLQLERYLPASDFKAEVLAMLRSTAAAAGDLADWFARLLTRLFDGTGLVLANPLLPEFRAMQASLFVQAVTERDRIAAAFSAGCRRFEQWGFAPTVGIRPGQLHLFYYVSGQRLPLIDRGEAIVVHDHELSYSAAELAQLAAADPAAFSPNVVLRPLSQGRVLPDLAYVAGPGEISYFGLYEDVFAALDMQMPVVVPRLSATLIEPPLARYLQRLGVDAAAICTEPDAVRQQLMDAADELGLEQLFAQFRGQVQGLHETLMQQLSRLSADIEHVGQENRRQIMGQIGKLEQKAWQQLRKNSRVGLRQLERLEQNLYPGGRLQERVFNVVPYLVRYGPDLVQRLVQVLPYPRPWQHLHVYLTGKS